MTERASSSDMRLQRWDRSRVMTAAACLVAIAAAPFAAYWSYGGRSLTETVVASAVAVVATSTILALSPGFLLVFCFPFVAWAAGLNTWLSLGFLVLLVIVKTLALVERGATTHD